ncbi:hypothetical protein DPMN_139056 [Dreissena polymorpha]|uniref:Uncharacterized protein n=1 Tax=Dreissena polymorpha TaxID=45954 RepID=A0A9D4GAX3_DREPO|nr:hypothetical protein DPMN_139056 [Dreissena polymorpha]
MSVKEPDLYDILAPLYSALFSFRKKRRSNLCLNKPKNKKRKLFPPGAEDASPGDRQPACTSSTFFIETPTGQCRPAFHDPQKRNVYAPQKRKNKTSKVIKKEIISK